MAQISDGTASEVAIELTTREFLLLENPRLRPVVELGWMPLTLLKTVIVVCKGSTEEVGSMLVTAASSSRVADESI